MGSAAFHLRKMLPWPDWHAFAGWCALAAFVAWFIGLAVQNGVLMESPADWSIDRPKFWLLYVAFALAIPFIFQATKRWRFDREIGELSYPLYLVTALWWAWCTTDGVRQRGSRMHWPPSHFRSSQLM
jgi:peptidoglycan/LPS O-acetylase OafA/YrhL